ASARIGDARSVCEDGIISRANDAARRLGATPGERLLQRVLRWSGAA
ncbi:MAG: hypothetical protein IH590_12695, partial [Aquamicrobium sp.]|nr:hypothetical protein [Aquamicrobium sp.]